MEDDIEGVGKVAEDASGGTRVPMPAFGRALFPEGGSRVHIPVNGIGGPDIRKGGNWVAAPPEVNQRVQGGQRVDLTKTAPINHPQARVGAPIQPLQYNPLSPGTSGGSKAVWTYLQVRSALANGAYIPPELPSVMHYWATQGVPPPVWLESMVFGRQGDQFIVAYAARLRAALGA